MDLNGVAELCRPRSREELPAWRPGDAVLAGGTWLFSEPQPDTTRLVELGALAWHPAEVAPDALRLAATCTFRALERLELPPAWIAAPLLRQCSRALSASFKVAAVATIGGNLCLALPAAPMAPLAVALEAACLLWTPGGGERTVPAAEFVQGNRRTVLRPGEMLRRIDMPAAALRRRTAFRRVSLTSHGRSAALVIGTVDPDGAFALTVAASVAAPLTLRFPAPPSAGALAADLHGAVPDAAWCRDVHGSVDWRRHMTGVLAEEVRQELATV